MSRILLADDSPHAQRMGERILREEGFEVVTVTDGQTALLRLADVDPDVVLADISLPRRSGYEICREIKSDARRKHVRVILTAGLLERFDEAEAVAVRCDAVLKKPFEATLVLDAIRPLAETARAERAEISQVLLPEESNSPVVPVRVVTEPGLTRTPAATAPAPDAETERIRAAVSIALDAAMPAMIDEITKRVLIALRP